MAHLVSERELDFLLYDLLGTQRLLARPRYAELSRDMLDAVLASARRIALARFAPHAAQGDQQPPRFEDGTARTLPATGAAWRAFADAGFMNAHWDNDEGGLQLPEVVLRAALCAFFAANTGAAAYPFLTLGAANLLRAFGDEALKARWLAPLGDGRAAGTMALTEPGQGSSLGDLQTRALPQPDGSWRLHGQKMFISGGDQDFTDNIVHMVLARTPDAPAGAAGISLFLVPKWLPQADGSRTRNDVALAGLLHKLGWRETTSTALSFGEHGGAVGWLVGQRHRGLAQMFQMMNEARIGVGLIAACLACRGLGESLAYARQRPQGRRPSCKDPATPQIMLIEHADVRRLLIAQKAYAEGALALCLFASTLFEDQHTHPEPAGRDRAALLLDVLTPVVKSWSSAYGLAANHHAVQVLGGAGYTSEYPLERLLRDQRLNSIHEGAEAIHGLDLLGRKVGLAQGRAFALFREAVAADVDAARQVPALLPLAAALDTALHGLAEVTALLRGRLGDEPDLALANATLYLDAFGRLTAAWVWLKQALAAARLLAMNPGADPRDHALGKLQTAQWFFRWELPQLTAQFDLLRAGERTAFDMRDGWF